MLGKLSVPGRPTSLDDSRARAYCSMIVGQGPIAVGADGVFFGHFFSSILSLLFTCTYWRHSLLCSSEKLIKGERS